MDSDESEIQGVDELEFARDVGVLSRSPFTIEGYIDGMARFFQGIRIHYPRTGRLIAFLILLAWLFGHMRLEPV